MNFREFLYERKLQKVISENTNYEIRLLKNLSPDGNDYCPNHCYYAKGGWYHDVAINEDAFECTGKKIPFGEAVAKVQYHLPEYRGGIIVFSTDVNATNDPKGIWKKIHAWFTNVKDTFVNVMKKNKKLLNLIKKHNLGFDKDNPNFIGAFSIGNFFKGRYLSKSGSVFDEKSTSIEINGVPSEVLLLIAIEIANSFKQETVLVKDLNKNKFYLADRKRVKDASSELKKV